MKSLKIVFFVLPLLLFLVPLPSGSNSVWAVSLLNISVTLLFFCFVLSFFLDRKSVIDILLRAKYFHFCFIAFLLWTVLQLLPLPLPVVDLLSPSAYELKCKMFASLGQSLPTFMTVSIDDSNGLNCTFLTITFYFLFCLILCFINNHAAVKYFAWVITLSGLFQAVFGSISTLSGLEFSFFSKKYFGVGFATGTFINKNNFAGCLEITLAMGVGLLIAGLKENKANSWREQLQKILNMFMSSKVILRTAVALMVIAMVLTHSRMGNTAFFSSLMITSFIYIICRKKISKGLVFLLTSMIIIDIAIVSQWFGVEKVIDRIESSQLQSESRTDVNPALVKIIPDYPITGTGGNSFYTALPKYHDGSWYGFFDLAHNDILQFPIEFGIPAFLLLVCIVIMSLWNSIQAMRFRKDKLMIGMGFSSFMGVLAILIHSAVDFNLQIPSNAAYFVSLIALSVIARYGVSKKSRSKRRKFFYK